jgi:hypothetical protein
MNPPLNQERRVRCELRLSELLPADLTNLMIFAERRLTASGLNPSAGEDVTQRALMAIIKGLESDQGGRVPRLVDLEDKETFLNFARGAISSSIEAMGRKLVFRTEHKLWNDEIEASPAAPVTPAKQAELDDLKDQLFTRLRARAPKRLRRTIDAWEKVFTEADRIPAPGHRLYVAEVKDLAKEIITELGGIR